MFACVGWKVTLCDPIRQVTLRSCEMDFHKQLYTLLYLSRGMMAKHGRCKWIGACYAEVLWHNHSDKLLKSTVLSDRDQYMAIIWTWVSSRLCPFIATRCRSSALRLCFCSAMLTQIGLFVYVTVISVIYLRLIDNKLLGE